MNLILYDKLVVTWEKKIAEEVFEHKSPNDLILNFDQKPFGFASPSKVTYAKRNSQNVLILNSDDNLQITGTITINLSGKFLPIQLIYIGRTDLCHPKEKFPLGSDIIHSHNQWSD